MSDERHYRSGVNPLSAGLAGLALGLITGVVAVAMTDRNTRKKVLNKADAIGQIAEDTYNQASRRAAETWETIQPKLQPGRRQITNGKHQMEELATKGGEVAHEAAEQAKAKTQKAKEPVAKPSAS